MVYFVVDQLGGTTGGDQAANDIFTCLRHSGKAVTLISHSRADKDLTKRSSDGHVLPAFWLARPRYIAFPTQISRGFFKQLAKWFIWNIQDLPIRYRFKKKLYRDKPELILFNDFPHPESTIHKNLRDFKTALAVHMTPDGVAFFRRSYDASYTEKWSLDTLRAFGSQIFNTAAARSEWLAKTSLPLGATHVLWCCCKEEEIHQYLTEDKARVREQLGFATDDYLVVCVGNLRPGKGQDLLIDALPTWAKSIPRLKLVLVGADTGHWVSTLRQRVEALNLTEHVSFTGVVPNAMAYTYAADVFVYPTRAESQGIAVLEAMALKTPVVATRIGGVPESIPHEESGLLVPGDDYERLAEAVMRLYDDQALGRRLSLQASNRYWQKFAREHQLKTFATILERILAS